jgi:5-methylcytosine-specific restriction endonuclease McrA
MECSRELSLGQYYRNRDISQKRSKEWKKNNPEAVRALVRKWRRNNPDKIRLMKAAWARENRPKINEKSRVLYAKNIDKERARTRAYRLNNIEKETDRHRKFRREHPEICSAALRRRRARKLAAGGHHSPADIIRIRRLQKDRCACCRTGLLGKGQVDHIIALAAGGSDFAHNLQLLCRSCNRAKSARDPIEFMRSRGRLL